MPPLTHLNSRGERAMGACLRRKPHASLSLFFCAVGFVFLAYMLTVFFFFFVYWLVISAEYCCLACWVESFIWKGSFCTHRLKSWPTFELAWSAQGQIAAITNALVRHIPPHFRHSHLQPPSWAALGSLQSCKRQTNLSGGWFSTSETSAIPARNSVPCQSRTPRQLDSMLQWYR